MTRAERFERSLRKIQPATTHEIIRHSWLPRKTVLFFLRKGQLDGSIERRTLWLGPLAHTNVYGFVKGE